MSIWEYMKKTEKPPAPVSIEAGSDGRLIVRWADGKTTAIRPRDLRAECPCAGCVDEFTRVRTLDVSKIPADLGIMEVRQVGNYAIGVVFADSHDTGIFDWGLLRRLSEEHPAAGPT
jgi:DUF971 family protein